MQGLCADRRCQCKKEGRSCTAYCTGSISAGRTLSKRGIAQTEPFLYIFLNFFIYFPYVYISCIKQ